MRRRFYMFALSVPLALTSGLPSLAADGPARFSYRRSYAAAPDQRSPAAKTVVRPARSLTSGLRPPTSTPARWLSDYEAQMLVGAPITRPEPPRNFGPVDLGGGGTVVGNGDQPAVDHLMSPETTYAASDDADAAVQDVGGPLRVDTTLYRAYYNPSFVGYRSYASYGGYGYGGFPYGWTDYPPWLYRPRYFYPYRYYPLRTGFSVYNPYFYYNNTWYGRYANPFWSGYGSFGFPYHFGGFGQYRGSAISGSAFVPPYSFGGFGYPYSYGAYGYPSMGLYRSVYNYTPTYAYFLYPGLGGLYVPPGFVGFPGYYGYMGYGLSPGSVPYRGGFYW